MIRYSSGYGKVLNRERNTTFYQMDMVQLGHLAKGRYTEFCSKHLQHICALALGAVHDLHGLEYHHHSGGKRPMVAYGFRKMD